jgi:hypothetical protein
MPLKEIVLIAARARQRREFENDQQDMRFLAICTAIYAAKAGEPFEAEHFFASLRRDPEEPEPEGTRDTEIMMGRLMAFGIACNAAAKRE